MSYMIFKIVSLSPGKHSKFEIRIWPVAFESPLETTATRIQNRRCRLQRGSESPRSAVKGIVLMFSLYFYKNNE
jgi:hypothetical protein